ncbi:C4-dicarboxylate TRAP transporter substrate-binding protein [Reyranella sp.]|uniref:C4-dicarboxylate TRAP transporter substrate-binding protein n=1 Tax=Reyranella sp. TaxID=1929291 RepID=UPI003BAB9FC3
MRSTLWRTVAVLGLVATASSARAETKLGYGTYLPPTHVNNTVGIEPMAKRLEKESNGAIRIEMFTGGSVAKATAAVDSIRDGLVAAGMIVDSYVPKQLPHSFLVTELAVLGRNSVAMAGATNEFNLVACPECLADQKKQGIISMAHYSTAPYTIMCKPDLRTLEEFKGKKIRSAAAWSIMFKSFGLVPVNLTSDETYEALQRGQVDCNMGADSWLKSYSLWDVAKNVLDTTIGTYHGGLLWGMSAEVWNKLPADQKAMIKRNMPILAADVTFGYLAESKEVRETAASKGVKFNKPGPDFSKAYDEYALKELARVKEEGKKKGIKNADQLIDTYMALVAKWQKIDEQEIKGDKAKFAAALQREVFDKVKW